MLVLPERSAEPGGGGGVQLERAAPRAGEGVDRGAAGPANPEGKPQASDLRRGELPGAGMPGI